MSMNLLPGGNAGLFETLQAQLSQRHLMQIESDHEVRFLLYYTMNDKDIPATEEGKVFCRKITAQLREWKGTMSEQEANSNFTFIGLENSIAAFRNYVLNKHKGAKRLEWEQAFKAPGFDGDVRRLLISRVYSHKSDLSRRGLTAFINGHAHNQVALIEMQKANRSFMHESTHAALKWLESRPDKETSLSDEEWSKLGQIVTEKVNAVLGEYMPRWPDNGSPPDGLLN
ncbi:hypothetical protein ACFSR7_36305 [Cohnella sp. GCM10020058]|uniref:hypothetical protein n=1 Tax=Cohnella sp. GCM10020058 TaxID=3317330 RepID=UPI0036291CBC